MGGDDVMGSDMGIGRGMNMPYVYNMNNNSNMPRPSFNSIGRGGGGGGSISRQQTKILTLSEVQNWLEKQQPYLTKFNYFT